MSQTASLPTLRKSAKARSPYFFGSSAKKKITSRLGKGTTSMASPKEAPVFKAARVHSRAGE